MGTMKRKPIIAVVYNLMMALATAALGAVVLSWPLLAIFVKAQKTDLIVRKSLGTIMKNYTQLLDYLLLPFKNKLQMSDFPTSPSAARHFYECKLLFELAIIVFIVGLIILIFLKMRKRMNYIYISKTTALIFMILPVIILPFALMNFDEFFISFHHLLFNNSDWLFDPTTDPIINCPSNHLNLCGTSIDHLDKEKISIKKGAWLKLLYFFVKIKHEKYNS